MEHIRQINSVGTNTYTIVKTYGYGAEGELPLSQHPSIIENPEIFEIANCDIPADHQYIDYFGGN